MALLGLTLLVASFVYVFIRPPAWMPLQFRHWRGLLEGAEAAKNRQAPTDRDGGHGPRIWAEPEGVHAGQIPPPEKRPISSFDSEDKSAEEQTSDRAAIPPPPPPPTIQPPTIAEPDEQTTPKATAAKPSQPVPTFSLSEDAPTAPSPSSMMPPPPLPSSGRLPAAGRLPSLAAFPAANSIQRARGPAPDRGSPQVSFGLAPPPTHSSRPSKPSRKVVLTPGHSPLDWARISGPNADLRGLPSSTPYLRVTPSMLKAQTGRKGKDAWMALNGKVYNITPYARYHPGGVPELMRGAAKDGTKLFGEVHPWVNYETMLSACLVGLLVEEAEGNKESEMEQMD